MISYKQIQMQTDTDPFIEGFNDMQSTIMILRRVQLSIGCVILAGIVANIIKRKIYVFNTTKLFMFCCICYLIGMLVVLLHLQYFTSGYKFAYLEAPDQLLPYDNQYQIYNIMTQMKSNGTSLFFCGFEAFINLFFYNLAYFFIVLISYNVYCVLTDNYRNFIKNRLKSPKIWALLIVMFLIYLLPFVLMYVQQFKDGSYFYSYGPSGFPAQIEKENLKRRSELLLFCGINSGSGYLSSAVSLINIYIFSLLMLFYHLLILIFNRTKIKELVGGETYLNSKQQFLINSGRISIIVFGIQSLNFVKLLIDIFFSSAQTLLLILNFIFDCYPFVLLYFFWKYTREKRGIQHGSSTILNQSSQNSQ